MTAPAVIDDGGFSPSEKRRGRRAFSTFAVLNTFSYIILSGNIITLYLVRLDASATFIGAVNSFVYISFFFMFLGRPAAAAFGVIRTFAVFWLLRYVVTIPLLLSPVLIAAGNRDGALSLIVIGLLGFQIFRGVGVVGNNPVLAALSEGRDRGDYLAQIQIITHAVSIITGIAMAALLGDDAPIGRYTLFLSAGILFGVAGALILFRVPEPPAQTGGPRGEAILSTAARAWAAPPFRRFMLVFAGISFIAGMARPFVIVYAKEAYALSDSATVYLTVIGSVGALTMGFATQVLMDRIGAKPLYALYFAAAFLSMAAMTVSPSLSPFPTAIFLSAVFFLFNLGFTGEESAGQAYYYNLIKPEEQLNLGILYFVTMGIGGTLGSLAGGLALDLFSAILPSHPAGSFRLFYGVCCAISLPLLFRMTRLAPLGSYSLSTALSVIFSARDLRAIVLLRRLDETAGIAEETRVIQELATTPSSVTVDVLLERLRSPSYAVRSEALRALERLPEDRRILHALIDEVRDYEFTTAGAAARILGNKRAHAAVAVLREKLQSSDYLLVAECMMALARMGDTGSRRIVERMLRGTDNPLLLIHGAGALHQLGNVDSLPVLFSVIDRQEAPEYLRDEVILAAAGILDMEKWFYPYYVRLMRNPKAAVAWLIDTVSQSRPAGPFAYQMRDITQAGVDLLERPSEFGSYLSGAVTALEFPMKEADRVRRHLQAAAKSSRLLSMLRFRFLLYAVLVRYLPA